MNLGQLPIFGKIILGASLIALAVLGYLAYQALSTPDSTTERTIVEAPEQERQPEVIKPSEEVFSDSIDRQEDLAVYPADDENIPVVNQQEEQVVEEQITVNDNRQPNPGKPSKAPAPPVPVIESGPSGTIIKQKISFSFSGSGELRCSLNRPAFRKSRSCESPMNYNNLGNGRYVFRVWSVVDGRHSPAAARSFTINRRPPAGPQITAAPKQWTNNKIATFRFQARDKSLRFICSMNNAPYRNCSSPFVVGPLADGRYVFKLRTVNKFGQRSRAIKQRSFRVDPTPPAAPTITSAPAAESVGDSAQFLFLGAEEELRFACSLTPDGAEPVAVDCSSPASYQGLLPGPYTFRVAAIDRAGNRSTESAAEFTLLPVEIIPAGQRLSAKSGPTIGVRSEGSSYNSGDTSSTADESQAIALEIDPAIEILTIASDSDTISPQAGGDTGAGDDAQFEASVQLRSNLSWSSTASETGDFGLIAAGLTIDGAGDTGSSNGTAGAADGTQSYGVNFSIDVSWADDASAENAPYGSTIDHDVSNTL
jgi:hypothetical protein